MYVQSGATPIRFAFKFVLAFAVLIGAFEASRGSAFETFLVEKLILVPTVALIDAASPSEHVHLIGRSIVSPTSKLNVTRGCEGVEMFLLLFADILAYPADWRRKAQGLLLGSILAYALTVTRLMALHHVLQFSPRAWEALHGLVLPLGPVAVIALYFFRWSGEGTPATQFEPRARAH